MHGLNTIRRLNAGAHADSIATARRAGNWVTARFEGLTLVSTSLHADRQAAEAASDAHANPLTGSTIVVYPPTAAAAAAAASRTRLRDQSEDYAVSRTVEELAALGASTTRGTTA